MKLPRSRAFPTRCAESWPRLSCWKAGCSVDSAFPVSLCGQAHCCKTARHRAGNPSRRLWTAIFAAALGTFESSMPYKRPAKPGAVRIFTAADVWGQRGTGMVYPDLPIFVGVGETTCCVGDFLAMVVADTQFHARQAANQVKVDYEILPAQTDLSEALKPGAPHVHPTGNMYVHGNLIDTTAFA